MHHICSHACHWHIWVTNTPLSILCLCPHFHLNNAELFLDQWVDRWASFRFSLFKGSSSPLVAASRFSIDHLLVRGEMHKLMLIMCTMPTVNGGFGALEEKGFWQWKWIHDSLHGCAVNKTLLIFSAGKRKNLRPVKSKLLLGVILIFS